MPNGILKKIQRNEKGITGLETAIILIAFVVVAAVFAYTALSAGLFSTQKSSEAVYSGLKEAQSTLELRGAVIATANVAGSAGAVKQITFNVGNVLGGEPIDFTEPTADSQTGQAASSSNNVVVLTYIDENLRIEDLYWTKTAIGKDDDDDLLEDNETFQITVGSTSSETGAGNLINALSSNYLEENEQFTIEVTTPAGAVLQIERTTPAYLDTIMNLR